MHTTTYPTCAIVLDSILWKQIWGEKNQRGANWGMITQIYYKFRKNCILLEQGFWWFRYSYLKFRGYSSDTQYIIPINLLHFAQNNWIICLIIQTIWWEMQPEEFEDFSLATSKTTIDNDFQKIHPGQRLFL